ncbi:MAG: hypothetical protein R3293_26095, partial [Candidatus Promineifilaceae bacterium]|nr:hypothetical protein [Candidatus Promineifilaceae bacterium]
MTTTNGRSSAGHSPLPIVRETVRDLLLASPAYHDLSAAEQREMAALMVRVCDTAARLVQEDMRSTAEVQSLFAHQQEVAPPPEPVRQRPQPPLAAAQAAGDAFSGVAAERIAGTTRSILNAVSFPSFVADLINGVFKAMTDSNLSQMQSYIDLLNNVAASTEGFADLNYSAYTARRWLVDQFPGSYVMEGEAEEQADDSWGGDDSWGDGGWGSEESAAADESRIRLRPGGQPPSDEALRAALGLPEDAPVPSGDP